MKWFDKIRTQQPLFRKKHFERENKKRNEFILLLFSIFWGCNELQPENIHSTTHLEFNAWMPKTFFGKNDSIREGISISTSERR